MRHMGKQKLRSKASKKATRIHLDSGRKLKAAAAAAAGEVELSLEIHADCNWPLLIYT